ncbi:MAG: 4Fe-4S dicluster domain-containing protein [Desulfobacteraceae bacterium]|nr:MAG: 4Fe-4S dicluster domain-containing protein [Desulfobacteraceae bacterium]
MDHSILQKRFFDHALGKKILSCIQCGTCSASCPLNENMDHAPREIFALIRDGHMEEVLRSNTPWFCVSCYNCMSRCPKEIPVTDIMYMLKQMATELGLAPKTHKMQDMYHIFHKDIERHGRVSAIHLMSRYGMKHPGDMLGKMSLGLQLFKKNRLEISPQKIKHPQHLACMLGEKAKK